MSGGFRAVRFNAGGTTHELKFTNARLRAIEDHFGCGLEAALERVEGSVTNLTHLVRLALVGEYSLDDVDAMFDELGHADMQALVLEALGTSSPEGGGGDQGNAGAPA